MRVLWISGLCPLPLTDGHRQRVFHLLRSVARRHPTTLLCQVRATDEAHLPQLRALCARVVPVRAPERGGDPPVQRAVRRLQGLLRRSPTCFLPAALPQMRHELERLGGEGFDLAIGSLYCAPLVHAAPARLRVLDAQNVESDLYHQLWQAETHPQRRLSRLLDWRAVAAFERRSLPRAERITVCSERDREILQGRIPSLPPAIVIPNGVDLSRPPVGVVPGREVLIFTGSMAYAPNIDAAEYLVRDLMPRIWQARPGVRLLLVGKDPPPRVRALASARVTVTGAVPEIRPYLEQASVAVAPLRAGGGTRLKILEAMAAGVPVVSTALGAQGLDVAPGRELAIADGPDAFAAAVLDLLAAPEKARILAQAARAGVEAAYGWDAIGATLVDALEQCAATPRREAQRLTHAAR